MSCKLWAFPICASRNPSPREQADDQPHPVLGGGTGQFGLLSVRRCRSSARPTQVPATDRIMALGDAPIPVVELIERWSLSNIAASRPPADLAPRLGAYDADRIIEFLQNVGRGDDRPLPQVAAPPQRPAAYPSFWWTVSKHPTQAPFWDEVLRLAIYLNRWAPAATLESMWKSAATHRAWRGCLAITATGSDSSTASASAMPQGSFGARCPCSTYMTRRRRRSSIWCLRSRPGISDKAMPSAPGRYSTKGFRPSHRGTRICPGSCTCGACPAHGSYGSVPSDRASRTFVFDRLSQRGFAMADERFIPAFHCSSRVTQARTGQRR